MLQSGFSCCLVSDGIGAASPVNVIMRLWLQTAAAATTASAVAWCLLPGLMSRFVQLILQFAWLIITWMLPVQDPESVVVAE